MANEVKNVQEWHPLFRKDIREIGSWQEWQARWREAVLKEELLGLLHCGFWIKDANQAERVCFYLEVADGYKDEANFELDVEKKRSGSWELPFSGWGTKRHEPAMRLEVARKALRVLVDKLFTNTRKLNPYAYEYPSWVGAIACPAVLEKVLWFFDADRFHFRQERNLPDWDSDKHDDLVLRQFINDFVVFCWQFHGFDDVKPEENSQLIKTLEGFRPQLLELMQATNQLWYLVRRPGVLDENSIGKLRNIALREEDYGGGGSHTTPEEAWVVGKRLAAMILLLDPIWKKEFERQEKLKEAEKLQQQAERLKRQASQ